MEREYDIILTHGGYVGRNHYQAVKAAHNALPAIAKGGILILATDNRDAEPIGGPEYKSLLHMLKIQGADRYLKMIEAPGWRFTKDQWEPEMWAKVFRKIDEERFFYCTHTIPRETYDLLPGRCGLDCLAEEGWCSPVQAVREMVETALRFAVADYRKKGIEPSVAFIREGPTQSPVSQQKRRQPVEHGHRGGKPPQDFWLARRRRRPLLFGRRRGVLRDPRSQRGGEDLHDPDGLRILPAERGNAPRAGPRHHPAGARREVPDRRLPAGEQHRSGPYRPPEPEVFARYFNIPAAEATRRLPGAPAFHGPRPQENSRAVDLSGGMIRRLVMARALLNRPELLILDEPTTGLDPQSRHQVWERLEELRADGLSILLTTHNMDEASRLCDRLIIVDRGRLLVEGKPAELVRLHVGRHVIEIPDPAEGLPAFLRERGCFSKTSATG